MDTVASLSGTDLEELFAEAAARMGVPDTIVEKDFWVCWSLKRLLALPGHWPDIVFKGGTSLSKVFKAIQRFSEDIDLVLDRKYFGCEGDREPLNAPSVSKMNRLIDALKDSCKGHIAEVVLPALRNDFASILHSGNDGNGWQLELASEDEDPDLQTINFHYPKSLREKSYSGADYIRPAVKLEFGCRGDLSPAIKATVRPYAAEVLPDQFFEPSCDVTALDAMRTFWEKATLLHVDSERPANKPYHGRNHPSRHYYDVVMLARSQIGQGAVSRIDLLNQVVAHKQVFFRSRWAKYETAVPGSFRLTPHERWLRTIRSDYEKMQIMLFPDAPRLSFKDLLTELRMLEQRINLVEQDKPTVAG